VFLILIDVYFFQAIEVVSYSASHTTRTIILVVYWVIASAALLLLLLLPYLHFEKQAKLGKAKVFALVAGIFFGQIVGSLFFLIDDIRRGIEWLSGMRGISRSLVLSWLGIGTGSALFFVLLYGFTNKYRYQVRKVKLHFPNLPPAFKGFKLVHISDIHSGSFNNKEAVQRGVDKILRQDPDLILFTGDLVNNVAEEMKGFMDVFDKLRAPHGVYSTLGNHDYGDYVKWKSPEDKKENLERLKQVHADLGWRLLMNEHVVLEKEGERIAVLGIENWSSKARFPSYGILEHAHRGTEDYPFKILMSHDPSHWKAEVCHMYQDIDLTLAGHTHGMQFGLEIFGIRWSPVRYVYKEWAGLYEHHQESRKTPQRLYINRGFGFIGYPGRVGILPEITVIELSH